MFCDLLVFILPASCEQTVNTTSLCDNEMVTQAKVLGKRGRKSSDTFKLFGPDEILHTVFREFG